MYEIINEEKFAFRRGTKGAIRVVSMRKILWKLYAIIMSVDFRDRGEPRCERKSSHVHFHC